MLAKAARPTTPEVPTPGGAVPRIVPHQSEDIEDTKDANPADGAELLNDGTKNVTKKHPPKTTCTVVEDNNSTSVELSVPEGRQEELTMPVSTVDELEPRDGPNDDPADDLSVETNALMLEAQALLSEKI